MPKPIKMKAYASYAEWRKDQSAGNKKLIIALEKVIKKAGPKLEPIVKWGQGCWTLDGKPKTYIHADDGYVQIGFYKGSALNDPDGLLEGKGKYVRFIKVMQVKDINEKAYLALLNQAMQWLSIELYLMLINLSYRPDLNRWPAHYE